MLVIFAVRMLVSGHRGCVVGWHREHLGDEMLRNPGGRTLVNLGDEMVRNPVGRIGS